MTTDVLLAKLESVRQVAHGRYRARCPAHGSQNRSVLSVGETANGKTILKCFAGCTAAEVVAAVGLDLTDLFPRVEWQQTGAHSARPRRPRVDWPALITACERDNILVKIVLSDIAAGKTINDVDAEACQRAATRVLVLIQEARHG